MRAAVLGLLISSVLWWQEKSLVEEVILLLESGVAQETILAYVESKGPRSPLTTKEQERLRRSGATEALLAALGARETPGPAPGPVSSPDTTYRFSVTTRAVVVPVSVTDNKGRPITDLKKEDFRVFEEGKLQEIDFFSMERKLLRIAVLLDVSGSMEVKIDEVADALKHFMELLEAEDQILVLTFNNVPRVVQDFTADRRRLGNVLERLTASGGTALHDAVIEGLSHLDSVPGESKALVVITDGMDTASQSSLDDALEAARQAETPVYAIGLGHRRGFSHFGSHHALGGDSDFDEKPLRRLAEETGGGAEILVDVEHHHQGQVDRLKQAAEAIALSLRHRYVLSYSPSEEGKKPGWRKIRVEVDRRLSKVRARKGYYSGQLREPSTRETDRSRNKY